MTTETPEADTTIAEAQAAAAEPQRGKLTFESDPGASRSVWLAGIILLLIILWMGSGLFIKDEPVAAAPVVEPEPPKVVVRNSQASAVTLNFRAEGQAEPERDTGVRSEASGTALQIEVAKGDNVEAGAVIAQLSTEEAEASLDQARQEQTRAQREFSNASELRERGIATTDRVTEARAALAAADAQVALADKAMQNLTITAPFAGRVETLAINEGEFVSAGDEVARIVDNDPLTVSFQVPQQSLNRLQAGQTATVQFITGQTIEGVVSFVGTAASTATRTFLAEIEVPNPGGEIPAGVSAGIVIPTGEKLAHFVEPSIVSLGIDGELGIKTEEDGIVVFHPIEIAAAEIGGIWATGLADKVRMITIGQGFVRDGDAVRAQDEEAAAADAEAVEAVDADIVPDATETNL
ncbi:efflux RND transporter periplasmic adaptor subunit [Paracoccus tegillarcae]|uniref:Efflux RND transporter periplasmic adaptor subunit n=1 Tax=Paracoccus tegillarcae TaxID=1529068 RepID=A0A2K9EJR4_9RHOB|nr:efflux RND transporter periplasmic adaptor subunit [Paracoccus tegillarcae]AUH35268.1 efflux RND transporter periplasmic adaptor subunit [Paracoccus tegillarcae]